MVAKGGGDFGDLAVALDAITDASATNRYLVKVMPGVYDIGETTLYLRPYVDIEGSGRALTVVRGSLRGSGGATVYMVSETELRSLSVESHALGEACQETASVFAIRTYGNPRIVDVAARAYGSAAPAAVVVHDNATPTLINVDLRAEAAPGDVCLTTAQGIAVYTGSVTVDGATVLAVGGSSQYAVVVTSQGTAELTNVYARGATAALSSTGTTRARNCTFEGESAMSWGDIPVRAAGTRLIGQTVGLTPLKCVGCFDADFNPVP